MFLKFSYRSVKITTPVWKKIRPAVRPSGCYFIQYSSVVFTTTLTSKRSRGATSPRFLSTTLLRFSVSSVVRLCQRQKYVLSRYPQQRPKRQCSSFYRQSRHYPLERKRPSDYQRMCKLLVLLGLHIF